jgi:hypothetical protein
LFLGGIYRIILSPSSSLTKERKPSMGRRTDTSIASLLFILLSAACAPVSPRPPTKAITVTPSPTRTSTPTVTQTATPTITRSPTSTLPAYPYLALPGIDRLQSILRAGAHAGLKTGVFSKVGDSLTANGIFLAPFGAGNYDLAGYACLQDVIDFFVRETAREGNSFINPSLAAKTGWRAEDVLDPARAPPPCAEDEPPLDCEFRIVRPAIAVILLGTNDAAAPTGSYEESMEAIIARTLERGILPILSTLPEQENRDVGPYNVFLRDLAQRRDVPLIDLSAALAALPRHGLGPDGIHLSWVEPADFHPQYLSHGMTVRNLLTLQMLDAVWKSYPPSIQPP